MRTALRFLAFAVGTACVASLAAPSCSASGSSQPYGQSGSGGGGGASADAGPDGTMLGCNTCLGNSYQPCDAAGTPQAAVDCGSEICAPGLGCHRPSDPRARLRRRAQRLPVARNLPVLQRVPHHLLRPIIVYQFNVFENAFSNDASLLLPTSALGRIHRVIGWPAGHPIPVTFLGKTIIDRSYVTVVGTKPNTTVRVRPTWRVRGNPPIAPSGPGGEIVATIGPFDVLNLETDDGTMQDDPKTITDLTGTIVQADQPIAVFSGVESTSAPGGVLDIPTYSGWESGDTCCLDHLEEQMFPVQAVGQHYVVTRSPISAEIGSDVTIDGTAPSGCVSASAGNVEGVTYEARRCPLQVGVHRLSGTKPFGIVAYGYGSAGSYAFAGGADVERIYDPPPLQ